MNLNKLTAEHFANKFNLAPHPEGGFYRQTYKCDHQVPSAFSPAKTRSCSTAIYFLLRQSSFSAFHKVEADEFWHHYYGAETKIHIINPETKELQTRVLGIHSENAEPQIVVPRGHWFAAEVVCDVEAQGQEEFGSTPEPFTFCGCTVSPGFEFEDFTLAKRSELVELFPEHTDIITRLTRQ